MNGAGRPGEAVTCYCCHSIPPNTQTIVITDTCQCSNLGNILVVIIWLLDNNLFDSLSPTPEVRNSGIVYAQHKVLVYFSKNNQTFSWGCVWNDAHQSSDTSFDVAVG